MKITDIKKQVKSEGRYSVFIDEKFTFGISESGLINSGLRIGQELNETELEELKDQAKIDKAYNRVLGLLARRPRSQWELYEYLRRKEYKTDVIEIILNRLGERGFVNDEDFARRWVESRRLLKPISKRKLSLELKQKRISEDIIRTVLSRDTADELEVLKAEIIKKRRQNRYRDETKLMQYLARQGYNYGDIKQALSQDI